MSLNGIGYRSTDQAPTTGPWNNNLQIGSLDLRAGGPFDRAVKKETESPARFCWPADDYASAFPYLS